MGFVKTRDEDETANLIWSDCAVQQEKIAELRNYQVQWWFRFLTCFNILLHSECSVIVSNCSVPFVWWWKKPHTNHNQAGCIKGVPLHSLKSYSLFQSYVFIPLGIWCVNIWGCSFIIFSASWVLWMISLKKMQNIIYKFPISFEAVS